MIRAPVWLLLLGITVGELFARPLYAAHYTENPEVMQTPPSGLSFEQELMRELAQVPAQQESQAPQAPRNQVPLLIPISGEKSGLGIQILQAAHMAIADGPSDTLELWPVDTASTPEGIEAAFHKAIRKDASLIIGPIFAPSVQQISYLLPDDLSLFTFSNDQRLKQSNLFVWGHSLEAQAAHILQFAVARGLRRFVAFLPASNYGRLMEEVFEETLGEKEGVEVLVIRYPRDGSCTDQIQTWVQQMNAFEPQAIFAPDGSSQTQSILLTLKFKGLRFRNIRFLGSSQWNHPRFLRDRSFLKSWFPALDTRHQKAFIEHYAKVYKKAPSMLACLAYNMVLRASQKHHEKSLSLGKLEGSFEGGHGITSLKAGGDVSYVWHVYETTGGTPKKLA